MYRMPGVAKHHSCNYELVGYKEDKTVCLQV